MTIDTERPSGLRLRAHDEISPSGSRSALVQLDEVELSAPDAQTMLTLLEESTFGLDVRVKFDEEQEGFHPSSVRELSHRIETGTLCGAQVTYEYNDTRWLDTLIPAPEGVRVVRVQISGP